MINFLIDLQEALGLDESEKRSAPLRRYLNELDRVERERDERLLLLFRHLGVPQGDWKGLAGALARAFVPGCAIAADRAGAKTKWDPVTCAMLRCQVDAVQSERPGRTFSDAVRIVAKNPSWKKMAIGTNPTETLRRRAYSADPGLVAAFRKGKFVPRESGEVLRPIKRDRDTAAYVRKLFGRKSA